MGQFCIMNNLHELNEDKLSWDTAFPTRFHERPAKTQISLIRVFAGHMPLLTYLFEMLDEWYTVNVLTDAAASNLVY